MWVVHLNGKPSFWLLCGETYTVGKKGVDVVIQDDSSISRSHLEVHVGELESTNDGNSSGTLPPLIALKDTSTYGTRVLISTIHEEKSDAHEDSEKSETDTKLKKGESFPVVIQNSASASTLKNEQSASHFRVVLGNHGATLEFDWQPQTAVFASVEEEVATKLRTQMRRCGVAIVDDFRVADYLVCSELEPSAAVMGMLCRAKPMVSPKYFAAICNRSSPCAPLPDPTEYSPVLVPQWRALISADSDADQWRSAMTTLLSPQSARTTLFNELTFVTFQRRVYSDTSAFLPLAGGAVQFDDSLSSADGETEIEAALDAYLAMHHAHVVLVDPLQRMPFPRCVHRLREERHMCCVEYKDVVTCLVTAAPLALPPFPPLSRKTRSPRGRATDPNPVFPDAADSDTPGAKRKRVGEENVEEETGTLVGSGWRTVSDVNPSQSDAAAEGGEAGKREERESHRQVTIVDGFQKDDGCASSKLCESNHTLILPPYPCFQRNPGNASDSLQTSGGKCFRKQKIASAPQLDDAAAAAYVPLYEPQVRTRPSTSSSSSSAVFSMNARIAATNVAADVDSEGIIPDTLDDPQNRISAFNAYDIGAFHAAEKRKKNPRSRATATATSTSTSRPTNRRARAERNALGDGTHASTRSTLTDVRYSDLSTTVGEHEEDGEAPHATTGESRAKKPVVDVFDIDALF